MLKKGGVLVLGCLLGALAIAAPASAAAKPAFGVVPQDGGLPSEGDLERMPSAGISTIRLMLSWSTVEHRRGVYDWSSVDAMVRETTERGLAPFFFLYGTPEWAARLDRHRCRGANCAIYPPASPATRTAFARFAASAVARYRPGGKFWKPPMDVLGMHAPAAAAPCGCTVAHPIRTWQIWNEQNTGKYFAPEVNVRRYASLLSASGDAIKEVDPGAEVILGGMWGPDSAHKEVTTVKAYLERLYAVRGVERDFDSIALHPYSSNVTGSLGAVKAARTLLGRLGDRRAGIWITELGWASGGPPQNPYVKGRLGQARALARTLGSIRADGRTFRVRGVFWYSWRDLAGGKMICEWCGYAGLRAANGAAKPAWRAFARVARR